MLHQCMIPVCCVGKWGHGDERGAEGGGTGANPTPLKTGKLVGGVVKQNIQNKKNLAELNNSATKEHISFVIIHCFYY